MKRKYWESAYTNHEFRKKRLDTAHRMVPVRVDYIRLTECGLIVLHQNKPNTLNHFWFILNPLSSIHNGGTYDGGFGSWLTEIVKQHRLIGVTYCRYNYDWLVNFSRVEDAVFFKLLGMEFNK